MSYSNYEGDNEYWSYQQHVYNDNNNNGDESYGASSQFNHPFHANHRPDNVDSRCFSVIDIEAAVKGENKLGLKLTKTPSLLNIVDGFKSSHGKSKNPSQDDSSSSTADKLKAANFSALSLQIGSWKKESRYEGDLVAKCYFKKRKLVWEVLDGNLKMKVEFLWSNILAIRQRTCHQTKTTGILEVLLQRSPLFFREVNPQPRKHTNWEQTNDFTNNQASLIRKHVLEFAPGVLEKHFDKIIHADPKLHRLSQQAWPNHITPYFHEIHFTSDIDFHHQPRLPHRSFVPTIVSPPNPTHIQAIDNHNFCATTNYPIQDTSFYQNVSPYQNIEQGDQLSIHGYDHQHEIPNIFDHQSNYYTSTTTDLGDMNQHGYIQEEQQLSYESSFPTYTTSTTYANSSTNDVGNYSSNIDYQYYDHDVGGSQWQ